MKMVKLCYVAQQQAQMDLIERLMNEARGQMSETTIFWLAMYWARLEAQYTQISMVVSQREFEAMHGGHV